MSASKIYELDYYAWNCKRNLLTGKIKNRPNIACMNLDGKYYFAHSSIQDVGDTAYKNFKGNQSQLITQSKNKIFKTIEINSVDRFVDSEAKLYEYAAKLVNDGKNHDVYILSELASRDSCIGVMNQFIQRYPNVKVKMASSKQERMNSTKGKVWKHR